LRTINTTSAFGRTEFVPEFKGKHFVQVGAAINRFDGLSGDYTLQVFSDIGGTRATAQSLALGQRYEAR